MKKLRWAGAFIGLLLGFVHAEPSRWISVQGILQQPSGLSYADGSYDLCFGLFSEATGGSALWQECGPVAVEDGLYSTVLGDSLALPLGLDKAAWLEVAVAGQTLTGRIALTAAPKSLVAALVSDSIADSVRLGRGVAVRSLNGLRDDVVLKGGINMKIAVKGDTLEWTVVEAFDAQAKQSLAQAVSWANNADARYWLRQGEHTIQLLPSHRAATGYWQPPNCIAALEGSLYYFGNQNPGSPVGQLRICTATGEPSAPYGWKLIQIQY